MRTRDEQIKPWGYISPFATEALRDREQCDLTIKRKQTHNITMPLYSEEQLREAERRAEQRVRAEIAKRYTWFYMVDDPESGHADMADMLCETNPFEIVETAEAADIRIFFACQDDDGEIHEFSTREEAEQAATKAIDAACEVG